MTGLFGAEYANAYDTIYNDKNYIDECKLIDRLLQSYGNGPIRRLLDLGCGTGNHALPLAQQGYEVVGVDCSSEMLTRAREKARSWQVSGNAIFYQHDICSIHLTQSFDACLMMFAVLGYQLKNQDVVAALCTARKHLRQDGLLIFDVWYGPAVLHQGPSQRIKLIPTERGQILRLASGELDILSHACKVSYRLWKIEEDRIAGETEENHVMRYFFPLELDFFLESSGFVPVRLGAFPEFDRPPDTTTWNVLGLARAE
jgi:SAM-dependent methyltransferase